jgi:tRNA-2-methylthio-N6-dimethylallyladenosine synthase
MKDDVPEEVKKDRLLRLNEVMQRLSYRSNAKLRGQVVEVLVEGVSKTNREMLSGRTRTNKLVHFKGDSQLYGQFVQVRITEPQSWLLKGELVGRASAVTV